MRVSHRQLLNTNTPNLTVRGVFYWAAIIRTVEKVCLSFYDVKKIYKIKKVGKIVMLQIQFSYTAKKPYNCS